MKENQRIKAALIDMDGVLYDSMPNHATAWMKVMEYAGLTATRDEFFIYEGRTGADIIDMMVRRSLGRPATDEEKTGLYALKAKYFTELSPVGPMPGAQKLVAELLGRGITTVLVTGSGQNSLLNRLETDYPGAFPTGRRVTSATVSRGKPYPDPYLRGLELAGVKATEAIAIDNAPLGTRSASAAGILTVGVVTGPMPESALGENGADIVINSMATCAEMLPRLLSKIEVAGI